MQTIKQLIEFFECSEEQAFRLQALYQVGFNHGALGFYPDGDFASDCDFCNGIALDIQRLETILQVDDNEIFDIYQEGHSKGLEQYQEEHKEDENF